MSSSIPTPSPTASTIPSQTSDNAAPSCTNGIPDQYGHVDIDACNSYYNFYPNFGGNAAFAVIFGLLTLIHLAQAIAYKKVSPS